MPDDSRVDKTALFYINKRIDKLEENIHRQIDSRFDLLEEKLTVHISCCREDMFTANKRIGKLEGVKNRGLGALALLITIISLWKVAG